MTEEQLTEATKKFYAYLKANGVERPYVLAYGEVGTKSFACGTGDAVVLPLAFAAVVSEINGYSITKKKK